MTQLIYFILGLLFALAVLYLGPNWEPFKERLSNSYRRIRQGRKSVVQVGPMVLTGVREARLQPVNLGAMVLPLRILVGGDGTVLYEHPGSIACTRSARRVTLPKDIMEVYGRILEKRKKEAADRGAIFENRAHVRLDDYSFGLEGLDDMPWPLKLLVSETDYFTIQATNYGIDEVLPGGMTIREKYAENPGDLRGSVLANPIATNLSVVTADKRIYIAVRGAKTATTPSGFAPAVSGTGNPHLDYDIHGNYNPFLTAQRETAEELTGSPPTLDEIRFFGLARTLRYQLPFLFGEVRLATKTSEEVEAAIPRDSWEAEKTVSIRLEPDAILRFVWEVYKEVDEHRIVNSAVYAALFSLLTSLRYAYPSEWTHIVKQLGRLPKKNSHPSRARL